MYWAIRNKGVFSEEECRRLATPEDVCQGFDLRADAVRWAFAEDLGLDIPVEPEADTGLTADQQAALRVLQGGGNIFLTGGAGTGKSYLLQKFIEQYPDPSKILVAAPTGVAAKNVRGVTLHRLLQLPLGIVKDSDWSPAALPEKRRRVFKRAEILIVDEISMCRIDYFEALAAVCQAYPRLRLILCGDFAQLPPILGQKETAVWRYLYRDLDTIYAFQSEAWGGLAIRTVALQEVVRQSDRAFAQALNKIRLGDEAGIGFINRNKSESMVHNAITVCGTNRQAEEINERAYNQLLQANKGEEKLFSLQKKGIVQPSDYNIPDFIKLTKGVRVMFLVNDVEKNLYQNGSFGTVQAFGVDEESSEPVVELVTDEGNQVRLKPATWEIYDYKYDTKNRRLVKEVIGTYTQMPLRLGYAVTVHKSQGQTYEGVNIRLSRTFADGQLYVALSRARSVERLYMPGLSPKLLMYSPAVRDFYANLPQG